MFDAPGFPGGPDLDDDARVLDTFVYCSRTASSVDDIEVDRIIERSQRRNAEQAITGVLVFGAACPSSGSRDRTARSSA
jgi:hypothetical protein